MPGPKPPKKSESLEIRIPYPTKQAFMAKCQAEGRSASEAMRSFIDGHLEAAPCPQPPRSLRLVAGAVVVALVGAVAVPSLALPSALAAFERLDVNGDHRLSLEEFSHGTMIDVRFLVGAAPTLQGLRFASLSTALRDQLLKIEFARLDDDGDGWLSFDEYRR
jgi:hypothetical protein